MKNSYRVLGGLAVIVLLISAIYAVSFITSKVGRLPGEATVNTAVSGAFTLSPSSLSLSVTNDKATFDNTVAVSFPYIAGASWPAWYISNTAPWNTLDHNYGKGQPDGYGPGTIKWTTDLSSYAPGTYTDTITLSSAGYQSVSFVETVQILANSVSLTAPVTSPTTSTSAVNSSTGTTAAPTPPTTVGSAGTYILTPSSISIEVSSNAAPFANSVAVSGFTTYPWPAWSVTDTAPWNTIDYHYGKGQPDGYGPGTISWTTNLAAYAPGTYTDTFTIQGGNLSPATFTDTVKVLPPGVTPVNTPPVIAAPVVTPPATSPSPAASTKFTIGDSVQATSNLNVRATPSATGILLATQPSGATGTVIGGPINADSLNWWQINYATGSDGWSAEDFLTAYTAPPVTPPVTSPPPLGSLPAHPRVWMSPDRVAFLKTQAAANTSRWQNVKNSADQQVAQGTLADAADSAGYLPALCAAYLVTGNASYANRAGVILSQYAVASNTVQSDDGYNYRNALPAVTIGLDWCYNGLTVAVRQQAATWLMDRADQIWPETNPASTGYALNDVSDNYYWGFMMTGPAALAAEGDDTGVGPVSGNDRPAYHARLALSKWANTAVPFLNNQIEGGADLEGTGYDISGNIGRFVDAYQTANQPISTPYLAQSLLWHMEYTTPGGLYFVPFGDQARVSNAPMYIYNRENMLIDAASSDAGSSLLGQVQSWLSWIGQIPTRSDDGNITNELMYYNPSTPSVNLTTLPNSYFSAGVGDFLYRQNWTDPNATFFAFESGPTYETHQALDANGLMIWKGSFWISASANIYSHSGIEQDTDFYNNLTIGGVGQSHSTSPQIVGTPQVSDSLVAVSGQAANAYGSTNNRPLTNDTRTVSYLPKQDTFLVVDNVTATNPGAQKVLRWQSLNQAVVNGNSFTLSNPNGDASCFGQVLTPSGVTIGTEGVEDDTGAVKSYDVTVSVPTGHATDVVVTSLQCTTGNTAPYAVSAASDGTNVNAVVGTTHVTIPLNSTQPVTEQ